MNEWVLWVGLLLSVPLCRPRDELVSTFSFSTLYYVDDSVKMHFTVVDLRNIKQKTYNAADAKTALQKTKALVTGFMDELSG